MKMNNFIAVIILISTFIIASCNSKPSNQSSTVPENKAETTKETSKGKYAIKSGIVEYKAQMMGMDVKQILTFDEYGQKEITEVIMDMMGAKTHSVTLNKDGYQYQYDLVQKTGTKSRFYGNGSLDLDFENMSKEMIKDMNLKKEGTADYLGKTCEKMSVDYQKMQMKGNFLVYKGVALKMDVDMGSMKVNLAGEKFEENPSIAANKFEVPADVTITEK